MLTKEALDKIRTRCEAAMPFRLWIETHEGAEFAAHAREDVFRLLSSLEDAKVRIRWLERVADIRGDCDYCEHRDSEYEFGKERYGACRYCDNGRWKANWEFDEELCAGENNERGEQ